VIAEEDQLFPDHSGFDWKSIKKAMEYNKKKPNRTVVVVRSVSKWQRMFSYGREKVLYEKAWKPILPL
jgi:hypothetical protein